VQERMLEIAFESRFLLEHVDWDGSLTEFTRLVEEIMRDLPADAWSDSANRFAALYVFVHSKT
jgi:hypothetical protein